MTTANPQPVGTHPESSDDLIAELARLMAQDAPAPRAPTSSLPTQSAPEPRPSAAPSVRIPGASAAPAPAGQASGNPFDFDFGFSGTAKAPERAAATPTAPLVTAPVVTASPNLTPRPQPQPEPQPAVSAEADDPIAALIAAELDSSFARPAAPVAQPPAPVVQAEMQRRHEDAALPVPFEARAPEPAPRRPTEPDRFATAPVFGLVSRPTPHPTVPADDPMSEIEGLIGQAVRVELANVQPRVESRPEVPAAVVPVPQSRMPARVEPASIDETILAAAAATGSDVDMVDEPLFATPEPRRTAKAAMPKIAMPKLAVPKMAMPKVAMPKMARRAEPDADLAPRARRGFARPLIGFGVAAAFLAVAGLGLWTVLGLNQPSGDAPVLTADSSPVKEAPPPAAANPATAERSIVLDEMAAKPSDAAAADEQLVSRDQADGSEVTEVAAVADDDADAALASRKVRTITVRPDGTIVNGDAALAGAEVLPVERPNVPELPARDQVAAEMLAAVRPPNADTPPTPLALADTTQAAMVSPAPISPSAGPPVTVAFNAAGEQVPFPMPRPANREYVAAAAPVSTPAPAALAPVNAVVDDDESVGAVDLMGKTPDATLTPRVAAVESKPPVTTANIASAYVQLSSQRSEEAARASASSINGRFSNLFNGKKLEIQRVDLGEKGIYFRVRLPAATLNEAANICANVKANGGDCFALNG